MSDIPVSHFTDPATIRLISTAYIEEPALDPLADDQNDLTVLEQLEGLTSARRNASLPLPGGITKDELLTQAAGFGWTYINAAFCYTRPTGNRFNGPSRGAWYAAFGENAAQTAQTEVIWHLTRELDAVGVYENITCYRELMAGFTTRFHDLRKERNHPALGVEVETAWPEGQSLAVRLFADGSNGVLYPSIRHHGGFCLAAFRPHLIQNIGLGQTYRMCWNGARSPEIAPQ
ncbi:MAG: RES family NAD+ phosphorylase [Cohaesibacteraceae bacterium]|nr:RES family NAD+ phosphorylase [Cohaesibacteraceae bacterium]